MKKYFLTSVFGLILTNVCYATDVGLAWYDNGSTISGPSSCTIGGTFVPPTPPARPGYRFTGWKAYTCASRIQGLNTTIDGTAYGYSTNYGTPGYNESRYGLTVGSGQWAAQFSYGTVYGMANCNTTNGGTRGTVNNNLRTESSGQYCWCQATGFTPTCNDYTSGPQCTVSPTSSRWVFNGDGQSSDICALYCAYSCGTDVRGSAVFRPTMFGAVGP